MWTGIPDEGIRVTYGGTSNKATECVRIVSVYNLNWLGPTTANAGRINAQDREMPEDRKDKNQ